MSLTENRKKLQAIVIIVVVLIVVAILIPILFIKNQSKSKTTVEKVIPSAEQTGQANSDSVKTIKQKIIDSQLKNQNGDLIIQDNDSFQIKYVPTLQIFFATIRKEPVESVKKSSEKFFLDAGLKQKDLCSLPVRFNLESFQLKNANKSFNILPNGCN